jgi:hypothetical protein
MIINIVKRQKFGKHGFMMEYQNGRREYFIDHEHIKSIKDAVNRSGFLQLLCPDMLNDMVIHLVHSS